MAFLLGFLILVFLIIIIFFLSSSSTKKVQETTTYGPPSYPLIGSILSFNKNRHRLLQWYTELLRISPSQTILVPLLGNRRTIVTTNPENVEYILKTNFFNFPKGKPFTDLLGDLLGGGIFNVDGHSWSSQRKLASHEFSTRSLRSFAFEVLKDEVENRLVPVLSAAADVGTTVDLQDVLKRFAFDVVCKVSLGWDPDCLDLTRPVNPLVEAFDTAAEISARRATEPVYAVWMVKRVLNVGSERRLREAIRTVHVLVSEIVRAKKKSLEIGIGEEAKQDLLSRFLAAGHNGEAVRDMVISFIMAGRDTTSAAMTWLFWLLTENDDVERKILEEVDPLVSLGLGFEDLKEMNYTKACLCEAMRLYPPVSWDSKHAANDDVLPDGTRVKRGDKVTYFPYGMGRMETLWGTDSEEFKPNRWFDSEPGSTRPVLKPISPYKFPVFQAGPRVCVGKEMAFMQMKYVVGSVLSRFEIIPVNQDRPVFVPLLTAHMAGGLKVKIKRRSHILNNV
ncbi:Cytochrome P450 [Arabidopsis thaliana x Arabidopsis arenosa]|uniref:Cytochrome P450 n=1 Tax=Arabidopsis thaliana x Arabidopsis arenosa TaxID=1240361 RepID=A0A8T1ZNG5_9BRAS|nr:Cytochrome P450 [Arabidopsis thaliana x Arabidopsis arenosa]